MIRATIVLLAVLAVSQALPRRLRGDHVDFEPEIVGGSQAEIRDFPYQISLMDSGSHSCGGSILSANYILTAGHCVDDVYYAAQLSIRAGSTSIARGGQVVRVRSFQAHPQFSMQTMRHDAAVLRLRNSIVLGANAQVTRLVAANAAPRDGSVLTVSGWGTLHSGDTSVPSHLMAVSVPVQSLELCKRNYQRRGYLVDNTMICAGVTGRDACQGDSGGPIVDASKNQVGIVSWGVGCAFNGLFGVYSNLANPTIRNWIIRTAQLSA